MGNKRAFIRDPSLTPDCDNNAKNGANGTLLEWNPVPSRWNPVPSRWFHWFRRVVGQLSFLIVAHSFVVGGERRKDH
jgi:hypothetical protein